MVDPIHIGLLAVPEHFSHLNSRSAKSAPQAHPVHSCHEHNTMPVIGGHKTLASLLHLSSSNKADGRAAFSPYTGSLSDNGGAREPGSTAQPGADSRLSTPASLSLGTSITLNIRYVARDMWRKVTFPPGITVTQARDICMLRFNVWQQTLANNEALEPAVAAVAAGDREQHQHQQPAFVGTRRDVAGAISPGGGATAGFTSYSGGGGGGGGGAQGQSELREQYGLFWTSAGHWLESDEMLSAYPLRKSEVLELQHIVDFIPLLPHEFRFSYAEGYLYHLRPGGSRAGWQLCWTVLRGCVLRLHRQKGQQDPDFEIDLSHPFRLTDQDGRSWPRNSSKNSGAADAAAIQSLIESLPGDPASDASGGSGGGGVFVVQTLAGNSSTATLQQPDARHTHAFRSCNVFDYDTWHRALRHMATSAAAGGVGSSMSASASISGASNTSNGGMHPLDAAGPAAGHGGGDMHHMPGDGATDSSSRTLGVGAGLAMALSPQISHRLRPSSTRHEGYVNRKQPNGYGFRRRYCVLLPAALYGFLHADDCSGVAEGDMLDKCEFAVALDPSAVTIEAIAWNGRYLLRVFGSDSRSLRDKPGATSLQQSETSRIQCTDILATAAQAAIEQYGSTFGMLPDARELVRLMIEDSDEGQTWTVAFNSIAGLQITGQSKIIIGARRTTSLGESKSHANLKPVAEDYHAAVAGQGAAAALDECDELVDAAATLGPASGKQQSLSEFIISQIVPAVGQAQQPPQQKHRHHHQSPPAPQQPLPPPQRPHGAQHSGAATPQRPAQKQQPHDARPSNRGGTAEDAKAAPKWIPLSIDKYIKEEEERKRGHDGPGYDGMPGLQHVSTRSSSGGHGLQSKPSDISNETSDGDTMALHGHPLHGYNQDHSASSHGARPPARFNWFKRRGSTSK